MDAWTEWFLDQMKARQWTSDELGRNSRLSSTMISRYRRGVATPRRADQIEKIVEVFGEAGPLPEADREERRLLSERVAALEAELRRLHERVAAIERDAGGASRGEAVRAGVKKADEVARRVRARAPGEEPKVEKQPRRSAG